MRIAICDDDAFECDHVVGLVRELGTVVHNSSYEITVFRSGTDLLTAVDAAPFDLYLLDIVMPGLSGIELAARLGERQRLPNIIFLTSSQEYALDAFRVWARGYLLKPVTSAALKQALEQVPAAPAPAPPVEREVLIPLVGADRLVSLSQIVCVESRNHRAIYSLADGSTLCTRTLRKPVSSLIAPLLESPQFILTHRAFVVNLTLSTALSVTDHLLTMENGMQVPVSKSQFLAVRSRFIDRMSLTV